MAANRPHKSLVSRVEQAWLRCCWRRLSESTAVTAMEALCTSSICPHCRGTAARPRGVDIAALLLALAGHGAASSRPSPPAVRRAVSSPAPSLSPFFYAVCDLVL